MGMKKLTAEEHFGELILYGCDQMAPELWHESSGTKINAIRYAEILELQAAHIRQYCFLKEQHEKNGFSLLSFTVEVVQKQFNIDKFKAWAIVKRFYKQTLGEDIE